MRYYKTNTKNTLKLIWNPFPKILKRYFTGDEKVGLLWRGQYPIKPGGPRICLPYENPSDPLSCSYNDFSTAIIAEKINFVHPITTTSPDGYIPVRPITPIKPPKYPIPPYGGRIEYRAYNCIPGTQEQLKQGLVLSPNWNWSTVVRRLNGNSVLGYPVDGSDNRNWCRLCKPFYIIAFFKPSKYDRYTYKPTYSEPLKIIVCPPCSGYSIWEKNGGCFIKCDIKRCHNIQELESFECNCKPSDNPRNPVFCGGNDGGGPEESINITFNPSLAQIVSEYNNKTRQSFSIPWFQNSQLTINITSASSDILSQIIGKVAGNESSSVEISFLENEIFGLIQIPSVNYIYTLEAIKDMPNSAKLTAYSFELSNNF